MPLAVTQEDLTLCNTLGLRSHAKASVRYAAQSELPELSACAAEYGGAFVLGGGSNVVLATHVSSLVIQVATRGFRLLDETPQAWVVEAQAGESWHEFVQACLASGWPGLENLALIPGTVGAAPVQNIGAYGVELDQRLHSVLAWDLPAARLVELSPQECGFAYRDSLFKRAGPGRWLIVAVRVSLPKVWQPVLNYPDLVRHPVLSQAGAAVQAGQVFDAVCAIRRAKLPDPAVLGNAGSFFKNPLVSLADYQRIQAQHPDVVAYVQPEGGYKLAAGWLIDRAGWKGYRQGPVGVHDRQALVLVNHGGALAQDVLQLARAIQDDVQQRFGVRLEQEPVSVA